MNVRNWTQEYSQTDSKKVGRRKKKEEQYELIPKRQINRLIATEKRRTEIYQ
jgi:hypothetical protein